MGYSRVFRHTAPPKLAVFITNMEYIRPTDFGYDFIAGFRMAAEPNGYQVDLISPDRPMQLAMRYDEYMVMHNYVGALFLGLSPADPWIKEFPTCRTPTVLYDNHISGNENVTHIGVDNEEGMLLAVRHLQLLGHRQIGYLTTETTSYVYRHRCQAFRRAMTACGLSVDETLISELHPVSEYLTLHLQRLLAHGCTAIICSHDLLASRVLACCAEHHLRIPEDISILGFDDLPLCQETAPPLSTIRQDRTALGKSSFFALSGHFSRAHLSTYLLHAQLIVRASCAEAPAVPANFA